jgi:hypothetical protein
MRTEEGVEMRTWTTQTQVRGLPDEVMALLTEPDAIARWAPIPFEVVDFDGDRLQAGDRVRVRGGLGGLGGRSLEFDVEVAEAADGCLTVTATGPIRIDVRYVARALARGSELRASVAVTGVGLLGRLVARATDALLAAGALNAALGRISRELEPALAA